MSASLARKPPAIFEVAALAGVSKSTVSNVIRGVDGVSTRTRELDIEDTDEHHDDRARVTADAVELVVRGSTGPPPR